jgi:hypothetical protein
MAKKGKFHGFPKSPEKLKLDETQEIIEYEATCVCTDAFLRGGFQAHTITVHLNQSDIDKIKRIARTAPGNLSDLSGYH